MDPNETRKQVWVVRVKSCTLAVSNLNTYLFCHYPVPLFLPMPIPLLMRGKIAQVKLLRKRHFALSSQKTNQAAPQV